MFNINVIDVKMMACHSTRIHRIPSCPATPRSARSAVITGIISISLVIIMLPLLDFPNPRDWTSTCLLIEDILPRLQISFMTVLIHTKTMFLQKFNIYLIDCISVKWFPKILDLIQNLFLVIIVIKINAMCLKRDERMNVRNCKFQKNYAPIDPE